MIWYPYTQMKGMKTPFKVLDAQGVYLFTDQGNVQSRNAGRNKSPERGTTFSETAGIFAG